MSKNAGRDIGKVPGDYHELDRHGDMEATLSDVFEHRPRPPNTRSGNQWVRIKAASKAERRQ